MKKNQQKKRRKQNQTNKQNLVMVFFILLTIVVVTGIIIFLNYFASETGLSIEEKKWVTDNSSTMINVYTYNDIPVYGVNGNGVIFDFLTELSEYYDINFNRISYSALNSAGLSGGENFYFQVVSSTFELDSHDILMSKDYYVLLALEEMSINDIADIHNVTIGGLKDDMDSIKYILGESDQNIYQEFDDVDSMITMLENGEVGYIVLPQTMYLDKIISNDLNVVYKFSDLYKQYLMTIKDELLFSIVSKYYTIYQERLYQESYEDNFLQLFFATRNITQEQKTNYNNKTYAFGYITDVPYSNLNNNEFVGTLSNYLKGFESLANIDFKLVKYDSIASLKKAFGDGDIDFALASFDTSEYDREEVKVIPIFQEEYVILSKEYISVDSIRGLNNYSLAVVGDSYLDHYAEVNNIKTIKYKDTDDLLRNINNDTMVLITKDTYEYYKNQRFEDYVIVLAETIDYNYSLVVNNSDVNETFASLLESYVSSINYKDYRYSHRYVNSSFGMDYIKNILKYLILVLLVFFFLLLMVVIIRHRRKKDKLVLKDDKLKFIDIMTSLKNRNYLNYNLQKWSENQNYPQTVIVVDLNNIKYINDNHGHEEGDRVIKEAANILIVNQLENSDIMRTDGNEFLIYMIGYDEKQVVTFCRKLFKDLKELPYNFGATLGHSMILNNVKTLEDAINEATIEMRNAKDKLKKND